MTMSNWIYTMKTILKCKKWSASAMRKIILEECLLSNRLVFGAYVVDDKKVWDRIVVHDGEVMRALHNLNIYDHIGVQSLCFSVLEQKVRVLKTKSRSKRRY